MRAEEGEPGNEARVLHRDQEVRHGDVTYVLAFFGMQSIMLRAYARVLEVTDLFLTLLTKGLLTHDCYRFIQGISSCYAKR